MHTPISKSRARHFGSNYTYAYSPKLQRLVELESTLEYYHFLTVEMDHEIVRYQEHPDTIKIISDDGKPEKSVFDMVVYRRRGPREFREIKYTKDLEDERTEKQLLIQKAWCDQHGYDHRVVTEKDLLLSSAYMNNLQFFFYRLRHAEQVAYLSILHDIEEAGRLTVRELMAYGYDLDRIYDALAVMYSTGQARMDLAFGVVGYDLEVWANE